MIKLGLCFLLIDWLPFGEGGAFVQVQVGGTILDIDGQREKLFKIEQFSWTSYVYHPLPQSIKLKLEILITIEINTDLG